MSNGAGLLSVGYEGRSAAELVALFVEAEVDIVADVRLTPLSRKPGLSKTKLREALDAVGIDYVHYPALGNPKENREPFWSGPIAVGLSRFRELMTASESTASLDQLAQLAQTKRVAILCFERDHHRCHRQVVAEAVSGRLDGALLTYA